MKYHNLLYIPVLLIFIACGSSQHVANEYTGAYNIQYALPVTEIRFEFCLVRNVFIPGPYAEFADEFLYLDGVKQSSETQWEILDINTQLLEATDESTVCSLNKLSPDLFNQYLVLSKHGFIIDPYLQLNDTGNFYLLQKEYTPNVYTDLSVKRSVEKIEHKAKQDENSFQYHGALMQRKTLEEKAEEAANFIIKTRKRRFKLIAGQYDFLPEGDALAISVEELNKTEEKYLSLFIGRTYSDTIRFVAYHTPEKNVKEEYQNIAYFSESMGMTSEWMEGAFPIEMKLTNYSYTAQLNVNTEKPNTLFYRTPAKADLMLRLNNKPIFEQRIEVYQYAPIKSFELIPN